MTGHSCAALTIAQAIRWVNETFMPRSFSTPFSARRFASRTSTGRVRNEVAVGTERLSFIAWASIAGGAAQRPGLARARRRSRSRPRRCRSPPPARPPWSPCRRPGAAHRAEVDARRRGNSPATGGALPSVTVRLGSRGRSGLGLGWSLPRRRRRGAPPAVISASAWPTWTVSSGETRSFVITPFAGAGTSASTLSVETSMTVSPSMTCSPSATCHSRTVPSVTDSPISGIAIEELRRLSAPRPGAPVSGVPRCRRARRFGRVQE